MKRNAISQWELSDHFWAESDPPEPCAAAKSFLQKCARQFDRLTADNRRVKYRLTAAAGGRDTMPTPATRPTRPPWGSMDRVHGCGCCGIDGRTTSAATDNAIIFFNNGSDGRDYNCGEDVTPLQHPPPCVLIRRADNGYAAAIATDRGATETFETVPYREVSTYTYLSYTLYNITITVLIILQYG